MVTDVAGGHVSKSQEGIVGDFGAPHCSLLFASIQWLVELPSGYAHEALDLSSDENDTTLCLGVPANPHPAFGTPLPRGPARGRGAGG